MLSKVDDGFEKQISYGNNFEFVYDINNETQNLFFLHGTFHIYKDKQNYKKITQSQNKALYDRLEEVLNSEEQELVCVFQHKNKIDTINKSDYLKNCLKKLKEISGNLVIIGSSLADNDKHIFEQINKSQVHTVFVSILTKEKEKMLELAKNKFPNKEIYLFDAETISYELPKENKSIKPSQNKNSLLK